MIIQKDREAEPLPSCNSLSSCDLFFLSCCHLLLSDCFLPTSKFHNSVSPAHLASRAPKLASSMSASAFRISFATSFSLDMIQPLQGSEQRLMPMQARFRGNRLALAFKPTRTSPCSATDLEGQAAATWSMYSL